MNNDQREFLRLLGQLPARLTVEEVAAVLNCQPHDIPTVVAGKLLKPLGKPAANSVKYFSTVDVLEKMKDHNWLDRLSALLYAHRRDQNARQKEPGTNGETTAG